MKIKRNTEIIDITHDDLVNLFSTALYGSTVFEVEIDREFYHTIPKEKKEGDTIEDKMADIILNGGNLFFYDKEDDGDPLSDLGKVVDNGEDEPYVIYTINLDNIIDGLCACANGERGDWGMECFEHFLTDDREFDQCEADTLLQNIVFNEAVYG